MGVSTDGILAYGWDLGNGEDEDHWAYSFLQPIVEGDVDLDDHLLNVLGYIPLPEDTPFDVLYSAQKEFLEPFKFEIIFHTSCDYPGYILTHKEANWTASRGYPVDLTHRIAYLAGSIKEYESELYSIAEILGIKPAQPPGLLLASLWC